jgi:hypothetical protein
MDELMKLLSEFFLSRRKGSLQEIAAFQHTQSPPVQDGIPL